MSDPTDRLSSGQRELLDRWLPGCIVTADLSWGQDERLVLEVEHEQSRYILKAGGQSDHHEAREIHAYLHWTEPWSVADRAPRMVHHDTDQRMLVLRFLPGDLVLGSEHVGEPDVYRQAGRLLAQLHRQAQWEDADYERRENERALVWLGRPHRIAPATVRRLREEIESWPTPSAVVVPTHGDWQPRNWLYDAGVVRAIDLGRAAMRLAATDFLRLSAQEFLAHPGTEVSFLEGYGGDPRHPDAWHRMEVREALGTAVYGHQVTDAAFEEHGLAWLERIDVTGSEPSYEPMTQRLQTQRLSMSPRTDDDAPWLARLYTAQGRGTVSEGEALERIAAGHRLHDEHCLGALAMRRRDDGFPVGYVALVVGRASVAEPELAYEVLPEHQRQGYATEAGRALVEEAWRTRRRRLWLTTRPDNAASLAVAARLGFIDDRVTTDDRGEVLCLRLDRRD